jgi:hypothetical protein
LRTKTLLLAITLNVLMGVCMAQSKSGTITGTTEDSTGTTVSSALVVVKNTDQDTTRTVRSDEKGVFQLSNLKPGHYQVTASKDGFINSPVASVELGSDQTFNINPTLTQTADPPAKKADQGGFFTRLANAYKTDWVSTSSDDQQQEPVHRGYPAPESSPPFPWSDWPYGGSPTIGTKDTSVYPLMTALYGGPAGDFFMNSGIKIYGWAEAGWNVSSSNKGMYGNLPAAYPEIPNSIQLDQFTLYIEKVPDESQTDHFDWGFRITNLYGLDYRFTTAKGIFSNQLLGENNKYGYDPVMFYVDLYFPKVADGMNVRIGRYISLPDIEAQLAPDNYTFSHSLTYTYDCYTQTGINTSVKLSEHWLVQAGLSAGCEAAPWTKAPDAKPTFNACVSYYWNKGGDDVYVCDNSTNSGKYAYNNLQAYYATWYHKFDEKWHTATEYWYMWEKDVPSIFGPISAEVNANGAYCAPGELTCYAPEQAIVNYVERKLSDHDEISIRNEFFDDEKGQRTGFKTKYTEHMVSWGHFIGTTVILRPEIRFERSYDMPAYDSGAKKNQIMLAGDVVFRY